MGQIEAFLISSRAMMPVIRKPEITKNTSTPIKPPGIASGKAWKCSTNITAMARTPSMSGLYCVGVEDNVLPAALSFGDEDGGSSQYKSSNRKLNRIWWRKEWCPPNV